MTGVRRSTGFSLIELLAVLAVLSVLALGVAPLAELAHRRHKEQALREALWQIRTAIDAYKRAVDTGQIARAPGGSGYPPQLSDLVKGVKGSNGKMHYFLRRVPRDPFAEAPTPPEATWLIRSYSSPPDAPRPGDDVYDVQSKSTGVGMDGRPYQAW